MASKRKTTKTRAPRKAAASEAPKRKRRKRKASKRIARKRSPAAASGGVSKRTRRPMQLVLRVEDVAVNSPSLGRLTDSQRLDLATMPEQRTLSKRPAWATDESIWRHAVRVVTPHWRKLRHPWPTVAWVYLRMDGPVGSGRGLADKRRDEDEESPRPRRAAARARANTSSTRAAYNGSDDDDQRVRVEQVRVDETGIDEDGNYRGRGLWWRVVSAGLDSVVRAASAAAARALVMGR